MLRSVIRSYVAAFRGLPKQVWLLAVIVLINRSGTMVIPFWAIYCTSERGWPASSVGILLACYGLGSIAGSYLGGALSSRIGAIRVQTISLWLTSVAFLGLLAAPDYQTMAVAMLLTSCVADAVRPAIGTAITEHCPPELHARALALSRLAINLGMSIGPVVGGFMAMHYFDLLFYFDAATCAAAAIATMIFFRRELRAPSHARLDEDEQSRPDQSPWTDLPFLAAMFLVASAATVFFQLMGAYILYFRDILNFNEAQIGCLLAINTISIVLFEMKLIQSVERLNRLRTIGWGCLISCVGFGVLPFGSGIVIAVISIALWTVGEMIMMPLAAAYVSARSSRASRGRYMGLYTMCFSSASVFAPIIGLRLYQWNPDYPWYFALVIGGLVFAGFIALETRTPSAPAPIAGEGKPHATP